MNDHDELAIYGLLCMYKSCEYAPVRREPEKKSVYMYVYKKCRDDAGGGVVGLVWYGKGCSRGLVFLLRLSLLRLLLLLLLLLDGGRKGGIVQDYSRCGEPTGCRCRAAVAASVCASARTLDIAVWM